MFAVEKRKEGVFSLPACEINAKDAKSVSSELAVRIIKLLAEKPMYPIELAKELKVHEQKVYYHIRNLEKAGIVKVVKEEGRQGAVARYYSVDKPAVVIKFKELEPTQKIFQLKSDSDFLSPLIRDGKLDALIIVGSPDPHGPEKARSRDGYYGMDLALFLGTFLNYVPQLYVKLDTEVREEELKRNNLIVIGGPIVNRVMGEINSKLPIRFDRDEHWAIKSTLSNTVYPTDEAGLIVKAKSPFNSEKSMLVVAGKRYSGTRAAIVAFLKHFKEIQSGNIRNKKIMAKVVEGIDLDSDGIIDDAEIRE
ncbi:S-layer protein [Candidatus Woesearchaeota archaeon]|nr:S-layer protein [Candidatus Woesearchaeota archaeon]